MEVPFFAVGQQDDVSKAHGTALTYAERYFLMKFFNIPTDEDDADAKQKQEKYNKVSSQTVGVLKQEVLNFVDLMKSLNKKYLNSKQNKLLAYKTTHQCLNNRQ